MWATAITDTPTEGSRIGYVLSDAPTPNVGLTGSRFVLYPNNSVVQLPTGPSIHGTIYGTIVPEPSLSAMISMLVIAFSLARVSERKRPAWA